MPLSVLPVGGLSRALARAPANVSNTTEVSDQARDGLFDLLYCW